MRDYQPKNILVTGGAGFIGANFIHHVLAHYSNLMIVNLDKLTYAGSLNNLKSLPNASRHHFIQGDICDTSLISHILEKYHIDTIVHFAAESHVDRSINGPAAFIETNILGTFTLLEAAKKYWLAQNNLDQTRCRFHHISTDEVYGSLKTLDPAFTEETAYDPRSPYSASKASSDHLVYAYHHTYGLPVTLSNCSNNYGPYQHAEKFIPTVIRACLNWQPIPVYGNGKNIRDWLYVEDHCRGIWAILQRGKVGERYNLGGRCELENLNLAKTICAHFDKHHPRIKSHESLLTFVTDRKGHDFRYAINDDKARRHLNWLPKVTFEVGLEKTIRSLV